MADALAAMFGMGGLVLAFLWLVRTLLRYRERSRWVRQQAEMQNKIVDKLTGSEELLRYLESDGGPSLVPPPADEAARPRPLARILTSLQLGVVLVLGGGALLVLRGQVEGPELLVLGTLGVAVGIGFLISGALSYSLSRSWGLLELPAGREPGSHEV